MKNAVCFALSIFLFSGCSGGGSSDTPITPIVDDGSNSGSDVGDGMMGDAGDQMMPSDPPGAPEVPIKNEATYQLTFTSKWTQRDHLGLPSSAHFSPVVLTVHNSGYRLFPKGDRAGAGFERVAETGNASTLNSEIRSQIRQRRVLSSLNTENMFLRSESSQTFKVTVTRDSSLISFVTMIAPSPDWVVGLDSLNLIEDGAFMESFKRDLFAYDGGTEEGDRGGNFSTSNSSTNPQKRISLLRGRGFDAPFAEVELELIGFSQPR